jgi:hypothetical protein
MTTAAVRDSNSSSSGAGPSGFGASRRFEDCFFVGMAILILASVLLGFAKTYFLAGVFRAPLPNLLIHIHGAVFSSWILLLITQTSLVSAGRVDVHKRLGLVGFGLACLMVIVGVCAATDLLRRGGGPPGVDPKTFYAIPMGDLVVFSTLIFLAFRARFNPATHKRLILIGTLGLMDAAIGRWPFAIIERVPIATDLICYTFLLLLVIYDVWSMRRVHRATMWAGAFLIVVEQLRMPIGGTAAWHAFAGWALGLAKSIHGG